MVTNAMKTIKNRTDAGGESLARAGVLTRNRRLRIIVPGYPAFNIYSTVAKRTTALGPVSVATVVNKMDGWDAEVVDENNTGFYGPRLPDGRVDHEAIQNQRPADIIGVYGGLTSTVPRLYEIVKFYKQKDLPVIAGGQHFVSENIAEALKMGIDYVVLNEGEGTVKELLRALETNASVADIRGIAYRGANGEMITTPAREPIEDFDMLPYPDFSLVRYAKLNYYPVGRVRGCGMDCEFCTVRGKPRNATPERLLENIRYLVETRDARHFFIVDDLFGQYRDETVRFCGMLREYQEQIGRSIDITVQIRLDKAKDTELLKAMRQASITTVCIGFESPIEEELKAMNKRVRPQEMIELARTYHRFGFLVHGMFIFGYPLKEPVSAVNLSVGERVRRFKRFFREAKIDTVQVLLPVPLPGTELRQRLQAKNRIYPLQDIGWEYYDGNFPLFEPDAPLTAQELQKAIRKIMGEFYRFRSMFFIGLHIFSFPALVFSFNDWRAGWNKWYRPWRNNIVRFLGWVVIKGWTTEFKKGVFSDKLHQAQDRLSSRNAR
ncbi:MAG: B12-binding domain-containing radical SAM protein [Candidatus Omnitrophica bacterium]|nr:B12-binding domain-containing radical SAM protein [Candidatus Omnitrophota bacterium]